MEHGGTILSTAASVCPECLARIPAQRVAEDDAVYLVKSCPEHGSFRAVLWRGLATWEEWGAVSRERARPPVCKSSMERGCPFDCGLCPEHRQHTCCVVLNLTDRCNLACQVCFASAGESPRPDPTFDEVLGWCRGLLEDGGPLNLHLSGGEPTLRDDLPQLIRAMRDLGFSYLRLNTNGIRLAENRSYAGELKEAGLSCVFLQFDGVTDDVFLRLRGRPLIETKLRAIEHCGAAELGVVLVPTLVPGGQHRADRGHPARRTRAGPHRAHGALSARQLLRPLPASPHRCRPHHHPGNRRTHRGADWGPVQGHRFLSRLGGESLLLLPRQILAPCRRADCAHRAAGPALLLRRAGDAADSVRRRAAWRGRALGAALCRRPLDLPEGARARR